MLVCTVKVVTDDGIVIMYDGIFTSTADAAMDAMKMYGPCKVSVKAKDESVPTWEDQTP